MSEPCVGCGWAVLDPDGEGRCRSCHGREGLLFNHSLAAAFGGPETERDRVIAAHEPRQVGGGPQLECDRCHAPWPCESLADVGIR